MLLLLIFSICTNAFTSVDLLPYINNNLFSNVDKLFFVYLWICDRVMKNQSILQIGCILHFKLDNHLPHALINTVLTTSKKLLVYFSRLDRQRTIHFSLSLSLSTLKKYLGYKYAKNHEMVRAVRTGGRTTQLISPIYSYQNHLTLPWSCFHQT